ncbi:unnamed protein product [Gongylonema pulchrum]|uniref:Ion_trans domain-containing protein n=1 Tax=Gongylonema pulchrum TaxID=637853 RepID=A0A183E8E9_9BILA|nr:unnamed protein product [Gongylonema pulchrum]
MSTITTTAAATASGKHSYGFLKKIRFKVFIRIFFQMNDFADVISGFAILGTPLLRILTIIAAMASFCNLKRRETGQS